MVAVVGLSGAGKSNLANKLLNHPTWDAFEEGDGTFGATVETQRAEWDDMVVIDTPGIPSHDTQATIANFDAIVDVLRREGSLSTLIFLVQHEDVTPIEFREYAILLRQLNQLPCSKLIVCRQAALSRRHKRTEEERRWVRNHSCFHLATSTGMKPNSYYFPSGRVPLVVGVEADFQEFVCLSFVRSVR